MSIVEANYNLIGNGVFTSTYKPPFTGAIGSLLFAGGGSSYVCINASGLSLTATTWTIEGWIYFIVAASNQRFFGGSNAGAASYIDIYMNSMSQLYAGLTGVTTLTSTINLTNNSWNHIALVYDSTVGYTLYVNGQVGASTTTKTAISYTNWCYFNIASQIGSTNANTVSSFSNFRISTVARYSAAFTAPAYFFILDGSTFYMNLFNYATGVTATAALLVAGQAGYIPCLCKGMLIRTPYGDLPIDKLRIGDLVTTQQGRVVPIVDITHRTVHGNYFNIPFRIPAHHFAENIPSADILLSPNHLVHYNKVIVPCQTTGLLDETALLGKDFEYFNIALPNYATDKMICQGLEVDSWNTQEKLVY